MIYLLALLSSLLMTDVGADPGLRPVAVHCTSQYAYSLPGDFGFTQVGPRIDLPVVEGQAASADAADGVASIGLRVSRNQQAIILLQPVSYAGGVGFAQIESRGKLPKQGSPLQLAATQPRGFAVDGIPVDRIEVSCTLEVRSEP